MKFAIAIFTVLWLSSALSEELEHRFFDGVIIINYDETVIARENLSSYLIVHPVGYDSKYHIAPSLRLCIDGGVSYFECGTRDLKATNFLKNARVNIKIGKQRIETLSKLTKFPELQNLVEYFKSSLEFGVWQNERLLDYYNSWDIGALRQNYKKFNNSDEVETILEKIASAKDRNTK